MANPRPEDLVCEHRLRLALKRLGLTQTDAARLLGMPPSTFDKCMAIARPGWRTLVEIRLNIEPGSLKF